MIKRYSDFTYEKKVNKNKINNTTGGEISDNIVNVNENENDSVINTDITEDCNNSTSVNDFFDDRDTIIKPIVIDDYIDPAFLPKKNIEQSIQKPISNNIIDDTKDILDKPKVELDPLAYKIFRDKIENFQCKVAIEGSDIKNTAVRLLLESNEWNIFFKGTIENGMCTIPLKKINILSPGLKGVIKLEIVVDGEIFYPWYETFQVQNSKNVTVEVIQQTETKHGNTTVKII